jgi:predicted lipoprotein with Yx(FWY)xxD motif
VQTVPPAPVADAGKAKPLYTWAKDAKAGDVTGDGVDQVWQVAVP